MIIGDSSSEDDEEKKDRSDGSVSFARHFFETLSKRSKEEALVCHPYFKLLHSLRSIFE